MRRLSDDAAEYDLIHWEALVRTIIERIGVETLREIIAYVETNRREDQLAFDRFRLALPDYLLRGPH